MRTGRSVKVGSDEVIAIIIYEDTNCRKTNYVMKDLLQMN